MASRVRCDGGITGSQCRCLSRGSDGEKRGALSTTRARQFCTRIHMIAKATYCRYNNKYCCVSCEDYRIAIKATSNHNRANDVAVWPRVWQPTPRTADVTVTKIAGYVRVRIFMNR